MLEKIDVASTSSATNSMTHAKAVASTPKGRGRKADKRKRRPDGAEAPGSQSEGPR